MVNKNTNGTKNVTMMVVIVVHRVILEMVIVIIQTILHLVETLMEETAMTKTNGLNVQTLL